MGKVPIDGIKVANNNVMGGVESSRYFPNRSSRQFMVKTMDAAVDRFQDNMRKIEQEKLMQHEDFNWRIQAERELVETEKSRRAELQARNYVDLVRQIEENKHREEDAHRVAKLPYITNGGPCVEDTVTHEITEGTEQQKQQTKLELLN